MNHRCDLCYRTYRKDFCKSCFGICKNCSDKFHKRIYWVVLCPGCEETHVMNDDGTVQERLKNYTKPRTQSGRFAPCPKE